MPSYTVEEAREQAIKAGRYFANVLGREGVGFLATRVDGVTVVVAIAEAGERLERAITEDGIFGEGKVIHTPDGTPEQRHDEFARKNTEGHRDVEDALHDLEKLAGKEVTLIARYHQPPPERGEEYGHVHLHTLKDGKFGRRERKTGECLCGKKHGSDERPVEEAPDPPTVCAECKRVAADAGLPWSLT